MSEDPHGRLGTGRTSNPELIAEDDDVPAHARALIRHFVDLRDNTHGGSTSRQDKQDHFARAVELLNPVASQASATGPGGFVGSQLARAGITRERDRGTRGRARTVRPHR
jgi:hypothetical protein